MIYNESKYNSHWDTKKLSDLGTFDRGKSRHRPRDDRRLFEDGKYPLIQTGEVKAANLYINSHKAEYSEFGLAQSKLWPKGTLCITIAANISETALLGYPMCFPDSVIGFNAFPDETSELFMHYVFTFIRKAIQNSTGGSIQDNINKEYLEGLDFKIPTKSYQDKIVNVLYTIDRKIDLNKKMNEELETLIKTIYDYWFKQFEFPNEKGKPYKLSGGRMVWNEELKKEIPFGWKNGLLGDLVISISDSTNSGKHLEGKVYTPIDELPKKTMTFGDGLDYLEAKSSLILYKESDILIGAMRVYFHRVCIAPFDGITRKTTIVLRPKNSKQLPFIYETIFDDETIKYATTQSIGTQQPYVEWEGTLENYKIIIPQPAIIDKFSNKVNPMIEIVKKRELENVELIRLREYLLPMLMTAQIKFDN